MYALNCGDSDWKKMRIYQFTCFWHGFDVDLGLILKTEKFPFVFTMGQTSNHIFVFFEGYCGEGREK